MMISCMKWEKGTESEFSRSSAPSSKESKKTVKEKGKEKGKGDEPVMDDGFKKGFKPDESSFLPEIKTGIDEYDISLHSLVFVSFQIVLFSFLFFVDTTIYGRVRMSPLT